MAHEFRDWFSCPGCRERDEISTLGHGIQIVFECHDCGLVSEFVFGEDVTPRDLDVEGAADLEDVQSGG